VSIDSAQDVHDVRASASSALGDFVTKLRCWRGHRQRENATAFNRPTATLEQTFQRDPAAFEPRLIDAGRVRRKAQKSSSRFRNGPGRFANRGLRTPARCSTVFGEASIGGAGSSNLAVVREIRAGQRL
jgi:hypothetical protein